MDKLYLMATQDGLTGIANRIHLENFLGLQIDKAKGLSWQLCVIMIDLDHFKSVNDVYGHQAGDEVLRDFGALLMRSVRSCDMAGRYGGEEFLIVLPETSRDYAFRVAERIREAQAQRSTEVSGNTVSVTISLGVADLGRGRETPGDLIKAADKALYAAKGAGRNRVELAPIAPKA
jgi:two-component system cell cycle response regulator